MAFVVVIDSQDVEALGVQAAAPTDADFRAIFTSWKKMDNVAHATVSIPSRKTVDHISLTSNYGVRSDPFNGHRRAHKGLAIPEQCGPPIYAPVDGIVSRPGRPGGFATLIKINLRHGISPRHRH